MEEIYDDPSMSAKPVNGITAFINQFDNSRLPMNLPANVKNSSNTTPSGLNKPEKKTKPEVPVKGRPSPSKKPIVLEKNKFPPNFSNEISKVVLKPTGTANRLATDNNKPSSNIPPKVNPKPGVLPRSPKVPFFPADVKENGSATTEESSFKSNIKKFNQSPKNDSVLKAKNDNQIEESNFEDDKIYYSEGKKYKLLKLPVDSSPAPVKPKLPPNVDIYEFIPELEEEVYEEYDDVEFPSTNQSSAMRPVSLIPEMNSDEENEEGQELYDDTDVADVNQKSRTQSYIDEENYEDLPDT